MAEAGIGEALERARSGDPAALGELFRAFEPDLARLCARLLGSKEEARDAAHEVFIRTGTAGARMQEIDREAGVNSALLHYSFRSKDRLAQAVFHRAAA